MQVPHSCKREEGKELQNFAPDPELMGKTAVIVGYSARALNYLAKVTGLRTIVIDCFADMDLRRTADEFIHVDLDRQRNPEGKLENSAAYYLEKEMEYNKEKINNVDYVLLGSSFENDCESWQQASKYSNYLGNIPASAQNLRNPDTLYPFLLRNSISFPKTIVLKHDHDNFVYEIFDPMDSIGNSATNSVESLKMLFEKITELIPPPFVLKPSNSGGGLGIFLIHTLSDFLDKYRILHNIRKPPYLIQEYIQGVPMSCSFFADGKNAKAYTLSHQIIGENRFGCKGLFTYCGNIMNETISNPYNENNEKIFAQVDHIIQLSTDFASLRGSNGLDFVLSQKRSLPQIVFMEINPRFQGTMDLVLESTGQNILQKHIQSIKKHHLPDDVCFLNEQTYMKVIYFSPIDFHIMVDLQGLDFRDVPLIGSFIPNSSPICTNFVIGDSIEDAYTKAFDDRDLMVKVLGLKSRIPDNDPFRKR